jgi:hypothetical protein
MMSERAIEESTLSFVVSGQLRAGQRMISAGIEVPNDFPAV